MEEKTLKELKVELVTLGMPADETEKISIRSVAQAMIDTLKAKTAVEKVETLDEVESPGVKKADAALYLTKARVMRELLDKQPKVRILLPLEGNDKPGVVEWRTNPRNGERYQVVVSGAFETVQLNGCKTIIPKGVYSEVPQQVADVIAHSYQQTQMAGANVSMDRVDDKTGRPIKDVME
jgi:hypothetical protein